MSKTVIWPKQSLIFIVRIATFKTKASRSKIKSVACGIALFVQALYVSTIIDPVLRSVSPGAKYLNKGPNFIQMGFADTVV